MGSNQNILGLEWLVNEVEANLVEAGFALDRYTHDNAHDSQLRFCQGYIHQVTGSLKLSACHGGAFLSEEMEAVVEMLLSEAAGADDDAIKVLSAAMTEVARYLRLCITSGHDQPILLLNLLNDLRATRAAPLVSSCHFFNPDLAAVCGIPSANVGVLGAQEQLRREEFIGKLSQAYQYGLLAFSKGTDDKAHLGQLIKVLLRLKEVAHGTALAKLWQVAGTILECLSSGVLVKGPAVQRLLWELGAYLRRISGGADRIFDDQYPSELFKNLLYYVTSVDSGSSVGMSADPMTDVASLSSEFKLDEALPAGVLADASTSLASGDALGYRVEVVEGLVKSLGEELDGIKELLDSPVDKPEGFGTVIENIKPAINRIADTLALVGQTKLWRLVKEIDVLTEALLVEVRQADTKQLSEIHTRIADVETAVKSWVNDYQPGVVVQHAASETAYLIDDAQRSLIHEVRNNLEIVKESVVGFISSQWDRKFLQDVPALIANIQGAIDVVGMARPARIVIALGKYMSDELIASQIPPDWEKLDLLADAITNLEHFLEAVAGNTNVDQQALLDMAELAMSALGYGDVHDKEFDAQAIVIQGAEPGEETEIQSQPDPIVEKIGADFATAAVTEGQVDDELDEDIDEEIIEIFVEEAREILQSIKTDYPEWLQHRDNNDALSDVRRNFHSLKGSGRMVNARYIGELGFGIEELFNRVIENKLVFDNHCEELMGVVLEWLPTMVDDFEAHRQNDDDRFIAALIGTAGAIVRGEAVAEIPAIPVPGAVERAPEQVVTKEETNNILGVDEELIKIFIPEAQGYIDTLAQFIRVSRDPSLKGLASDADILRSLHMLIGSASVAEVEAVSVIARALEKVVKDIIRGILRIDEKLLSVLEEASLGLRALVKHAGDGLIENPVNSDTLVRRIEALCVSHRVSSAQDSEKILFNAMLASGLNITLDAPEVLKKWQSQSVGPNDLVTEMVGELTELAQSAIAANCAPITIFAKQFADCLAACNSDQIPADNKVFDVFNQAYESLLAMIDSFGADQPPKDVSKQLVNDLNEILGQAQAENRASIRELSTKDEETDRVMETIAEEVTVDEASADEEVDPEIVAIFNDEAEELLEHIEQSIQAWRDSPDDNRYYQSLVRELHTFKGGARVVGLSDLGDLSHDFESFVEGNGSLAEVGSSGFFDELLKRYDQLVAQFESVSDEVPPKLESAPSTPNPTLPNPIVQSEKPDMTSLPSGINVLAAGLSKPVHHESVSARLKKAASAQVLPIGRRVQSPVKSEQPSRKQSAPAQVQEMVKISAVTVDKLVNLAGETNITRGRVEQKIDQFSKSLDELEMTVIRLQNQVGRMGAETEAQILFRKEQIESSDDSHEFDPLELDRYSHFQNLYSALQESASDLQDVKDTLIESAKSAELLLAQQSIVTTDLQENLILTRMVPVSRLVPRLKRVVRQVSNELDKPVKFTLDNVDGELDRAVLEKITGPLEHMIRNAIDHGLEDTKTRAANGKPEEGRLSLSFGRESSEIIIRVADDGEGLDVDAIRAKAVTRGLINESTQVAEKELLQLIFLPGFTTSDKVSQISGRGVGLDVVLNEVRELGGAISVASEPGLGTEFNIRVPFTVAVNRALMVRNNSERYALPLNSIVGVVKMTPPELAQCYEDPAKRLYYGGDDYRVCALSNLLNEPGAGRSSIPSAGKAALVLVATENYRFAVQVESLEGSQEIVIKGLGAMFNRVAGLTGVTVMGDGGVVVMLDLLTLLRAQGAMDMLVSDGQLMPCEQSNVDYIGMDNMATSRSFGSTGSVELSDSQVKTIMVVDDSVTVRKVTTRFLEREGFRVVTAKDGVDAVDILENVSPTLMLLDIEMPRMDGFDVARVVRHSDKLSTLPIIMISSRSGQKHRDKASSCGVNHFLGKPYREDELLAIITDVLAEKEIA